MIEASSSPRTGHAPDLTLARLVPQRSRRRNALFAAGAALLLAGAWAAPWVLRPSVVPAAQAGTWVPLPSTQQVAIMTNLEPTGWPSVEVRAVKDVPGAHVAHAWVLPDASIKGDVVTDAASYPTGLEYLQATFPNAEFGSTTELPQHLARGESSQLFVLWEITDCAKLVQSHQPQVELHSSLGTTTYDLLPEWAGPKPENQAAAPTETAICPSA